jgi:hypothetical protein
MRVKLCTQCPYLSCDLADHYDPEAELHVCATCDGEQGASTKHYPRKAHRRQKCVIVPNIVGTAQRSVARSVTESLALSATTPGEPPSVQRNALIASRSDRTATASGCLNFGPPPDSVSGEAHAAIPRSPRFRTKEAMH